MFGPKKFWVKKNFVSEPAQKTIRMDARCKKYLTLGCPQNLNETKKEKKNNRKNQEYLMLLLLRGD